MRDKLFALGVRPRVTSFVMEIVTSCPMRVQGFVWQLKSGAFAQTIIAKATFVLEPDHAKLAPENDWVAIHAQDVFVKDEPHAVLRSPSDHVPYKRRVDVAIVGHAYAPGKQPVRSLVTQIRVGEWSKAIEVVCDRAFRKTDDRYIEGPPFTKMPLDWTHAAGGPNTTNPVGRHINSPPDALGLHSMPNLQKPRTFVNQGFEGVAPIGYGPIAPTWRDRLVCVEHLDVTFSAVDWDKRPLPEHFDFDYFQSAPPDQQIAEIRPKETLMLEHLHPTHALLSTSLPGIVPRAVVHRASGEREDVTLVADTLWIDTDRGICCVVWRGTVGLYHADESGIIAVALLEQADTVMENAENDLLESIPVDLVDEDELAQMTMIAPFTKAKGPAMPFVQATLPERSPTPVRSNADGALPFGLAGLSPMPPAPIAMGQITLPAQSPTSSPTIPDVGLGGTAYGSEVQISKPGLAAVSKAATSSAANVPESLPPSITAKSGVAPGKQNGLSGTKDAPNPRHLRDTSPEQEALTEPIREPLNVIWSDPKSVTRMSSSNEWKLFFDVWPVDVFDVLHKGPRTTAGQLSTTLDAAFGASGKFVAPVVVISADLELPFDELEALKAAMSAAIPMITPQDEELRAAVSVAKGFLQTPLLSPSPEVLASLTGQIRAAFVKEKTSFPPDYLVAQMERVLLVGRHHQRREVFGETHVRALVWFVGESTPYMGYLPAHVAPNLPMWKRLRTRLLVEVHAAQDEYEAQTVALKIVAVARRFKSE